MIIAVDFDGTIVEHRYPRIGKERPFALATLRQLLSDGHYLILWTVREGRLLDEAVEYCRAGGVEFHAVNAGIDEDPDGYSHRKISADLFIDDRNLGGLPDWGDIYRMITEGVDRDGLVGETRGEKKSVFSRLFGRND